MDSIELMNACYDIGIIEWHETERSTKEEQLPWTDIRLGMRLNYIYAQYKCT